MKKMLICTLILLPAIANTADKVVSVSEYQKQLVNLYLESRSKLLHSEATNKIVVLGLGEKMLSAYKTYEKECRLELTTLHNIQEGTLRDEEQNLKFENIKQFSDEHSLDLVSEEIYLNTLKQYFEGLKEELTKIIQSKETHNNEYAIIFVQARETEKSDFR